MTDPTSFPNFPPPPEEHPLRGRLIDLMAENGLGPSIDGDGDVTFTVRTMAEGEEEPTDSVLFARVGEASAGMSPLRIFGQWRISPDVTPELLDRLLNCNELTMQVFLLKGFIAAGNLILAVDQLVPDGESNELLRQRLDVAAQLMVQGVSGWHGALLSEQPPTWSALVDSPPEGQA